MSTPEYYYAGNEKRQWPSSESSGRTEDVLSPNATPSRAERTHELSRASWQASRRLDAFHDAANTNTNTNTGTTRGGVAASRHRRALVPDVLSPPFREQKVPSPEQQTYCAPLEPRERQALDAAHRCDAPRTFRSDCFLSPVLPNTHPSQTIAFTAVGLAAGAIAFCLVPDDVLGLLQLTILPLFYFIQLPQIRQNTRAHSTSQLSALAVLNEIAGCLARLFTTAQEVGDPLVAAGFLLALLLYFVLGVQLWIHRGLEDVEASSHIREKEQEKHHAPAHARPVLLRARYIRGNAI
ncbi:hypothetical protein BJ912DRAFT_1141391 [Pholiota molesta]|nr:hypothetical protein BJ912DRAFT_1141391 [Pholiota molesta]